MKVASRNAQRPGHDDVNIRGSVRQLVDETRSFGGVAALRSLGYRALNKILPIRILLGMTAVLDDVDRTLFDTSGFAVRLAADDELRAAAGEPEWAAEMPRSFVDQALARGDECVGIFDGKRLVSIGWYARTPTPISPSLVLHFDAAWTYMYKGFTLKSHRGKRLHGIGMTFALQHFTDRGARGLISYVEFDNLMSLRSVERMGYRLFGDIYVARIGGRERLWSTPGCRPYAFYLIRAESPHA
jgi:hypothetical protein